MAAVLAALQRKASEGNAFISVSFILKSKMKKQEEKPLEQVWHYHSFNEEMQERFGGKVYKLSLQTGCTCPNRDGKLGTGGCIFCSAGGSGDFAAPATLPIKEQIREAKKRVDAKRSQKFAGYLAYFQSYTNTYGPTEKLAALYREAMMEDEILGLSIGTRPDCLSAEMIAKLKELNQIKPVYIELGLQTIHEDTAAIIRRGYALPVFEDAFRRLKQAGLSVVVHVIIGLPGENEKRTEQTVQYLANLTENGKHIDGIKLQLLHILKGTDLAKYWEAQQNNQNSTAQIPSYTEESYAELISKLIEDLPKTITIHRITGDAPKSKLIAPKWSANKKHVLNTINQTLKKNNTKQGKNTKSNICTK